MANLTGVHARRQFWCDASKTGTIRAVVAKVLERDERSTTANTEFAWADPDPADLAIKSVAMRQAAIVFS
jgi:hypothetical protein